MHQSGGGVTGDGAQSYAATVISAAKVLPSIVVPVVSFIFVFGLDLEYVYTRVYVPNSTHIRTNLHVGLELRFWQLTI